MGSNPDLIKLSHSAKALELVYARSAYSPKTAPIAWIHREGVLWHEPSQTDLLFVTLNKSEALFSPSTRYRDLALAADGDSLAAGAGDTGGVDAGDGVGGLRANHANRYGHVPCWCAPSRILRACLTVLATSTSSVCSSAEVS